MKTSPTSAGSKRVPLNQGNIALTLLSNTILRISVYPDGLTENPRVFFDGPDLFPRKWAAPAAILTQSKDEVSTIGEFSVSVSTDPCVLTISRKGRRLQRFLLQDDKIRFDLNNSKLYGLGHGFASPMNRRGSMFDMGVNGQIRGIIDNGSATSAIPYLIGTEGWACFFHLPWKLIFNLHGAGDDENGFDAYCERRDGDTWDLFVVDAENLVDAVTGYYEITGRPPMPPMYALGYQQSHRTLLYNGTNFMKSAAKKLRDTGFPCDMLIYLSTGYADDGWNTINGSLEFNSRVFEDPTRDLSELKEASFKVMLHDTGCHPRLHGTIDEVSVDPNEEDHAKNYWDLHEAFLENTPVDSWWPDDGDELDIDARLSRHRMYREGSLRANPDIRPLALYRNGYAGMTRWGGVVWSGDNLAEWKTLERQIPIGLNAAVSFSPYWCTDTGGFFSTKEFDGELFVRWFQFSAFTPLFRSHGRPSWLHTPFGWDEYQSSQFPHEHYESAYYTSMSQTDDGISPDSRIEPICRRFTELRYRLMPYIYTYARKAHDTGMPFMRPMWLAFGADGWFSGVDDQYMLGDSLLVCPIYTKAATRRKVALPEGTWYGLFDSNIYIGGTHTTVDAPLETMPVMVPAGSIIPLGDVVQYVGEDGHVDENGFANVELTVYTGADAEFILYEDDGISMAYENDMCTWTTFRWHEGDRKLEMTGESALHAGRERRIKARFIPDGQTSEITCKYGPIE
jgi:alpha-glucosidase (family GH31 glycosyl hydrolase)